MIIGTAGHIDHGKTALVRALTGVDTDRLPEEKRRGITIDLGFAPLRLPNGETVGVVDVPGHEAFVRTMVAGASGIDLALLVVAADEGVMPQTREHARIIELLAIPRVMIVVTKADLAEQEWIDLVIEEARSLFDRDRAPLAFAVSSTTRRGLEELKTAIATVAGEIRARATDDLFRLPIDRAFTVKGTGTVVTGTVWSGVLRRDDAVSIMPSGREVRVRSLQAHSQSVDEVHAGQRAAVALVGADLDEVARGAVLVGGAGWRPTTRLLATVALTEEGVRALRPRSKVRFHLGTADVGARVVFGPERNAARVVLDQPIVARGGDRFVLRASAPLDTIGGGQVIDPAPLPRSRRGPSTSIDESLAAMVESEARLGVSLEDLAVRLGLRPIEVEDLVRRNADRFVTIAGRLWSAASVVDAEKRVPDLVRTHHRQSPLDDAASLAAIKVALGGAAVVADEAIARALRSGKVVSFNGGLRLPDWSPGLSSDDSSLAERLSAELDRGAWEPPSAAELAARFGDRSKSILRFLEKSGRIVQVDPDRYYSAPHLDAILDQIGSAMRGKGPSGPSDLKESVKLSRKYLIPLLEFCDRRGLTVRTEAGRVWRGP